MMMTDESECRECRVAVALGMYLDICREMNVEELDCEDLYGKVIRNKITPQEVFDTIKRKAPPEKREVLEYIDWMKEQRMEDLEK